MNDIADTHYQTITLVLSDGRRVSYTGKPQIDADNPTEVTQVLVHKPVPLPAGYSWGSTKFEVLGEPAGLQSEDTPLDEKRDTA